MKTKDLALFAAYMAIVVVSTSSLQFFPTVTVHMSNGVVKPGAPVVSLHCKSWDDDLGFKQLRSGEEFKWSFSKNIWGTTKFWCTIWWDSNLIEKIVYEAIYDQLNDSPQLYYKATEEGLWFSFERHRDWFDLNPWGYSDWSRWSIGRRQ